MTGCVAQLSGQALTTKAVLTSRKRRRGSRSFPNNDDALPPSRPANSHKAPYQTGSENKRSGQGQKHKQRALYLHNATQRSCMVNQLALFSLSRLRKADRRAEAGVYPTFWQKSQPAKRPSKVHVWSLVHGSTEKRRKETKQKYPTGSADRASRLTLHQNVRQRFLSSRKRNLRRRGGPIVCSTGAPCRTSEAGGREGK